MSNDNLYKDFIEAVRQDSEVVNGLVDELRYSNEKMEHATRILSESLVLQRKHFDYLDRRFERINKLFKKLCTSNEN
jgi:hypothetical protein